MNSANRLMKKLLLLVILFAAGYAILNLVHPVALFVFLVSFGVVVLLRNRKRVMQK